MNDEEMKQNVHINLKTHTHTIKRYANDKSKLT